jgi:Spy/CpxP family protein refolding chaperone
MKTNMNKRSLLIGTALAGILSLGSIAYAGPSCKHGGGKHGEYSAEKKAEYMQKRLDRMSAKLGLSETQKTQVQALMQNHRNTMKPLRDEKRALRQEMKNLDPAATDYAEKLAGVANRKGALESQITLAKGNKRQQMAQILTPEQRAKMQEMRAKHKGMRGHKRHHGKHQN